jgi:hypothetical protein
MVKGLSLLLVCLIVCASAHAASRPSTVAEILEDDGATLITKLQDESGGRSIADSTDLFSGRSSLRVMPMQLQQRVIPNWRYRITEHPKIGEYRFIRFAWKAPGAKGVMLQMHDIKDWNLRLTAGIDEPKWGTKFVAPVPPQKWTVVTRDLFADFGERTITGIALTVFGQQPGYFDHIYLARTIEELDAIDATAYSEAPPQLKPEDLERLWGDLASDDASKTYAAYWKLAAAPAQSVSFLRKTLLWPRSPEAKGLIERWIIELEADEFRVRDNAFRNLEQHVEAAVDQLKMALPTAMPESQMRIEELLKFASLGGKDTVRAQQARRLLKQMRMPEASAVLDELSKEHPVR